MKSYSDDIPKSDSLKDLETNVSLVGTSLTNTKKTVELVAVIGVIALVFSLLGLLFSFYIVDRTAMFAKQTRDRLDVIEQHQTK